MFGYESSRRRALHDFWVTSRWSCDRAQFSNMWERLGRDGMRDWSLVHCEEMYVPEE